MVWRVLFLLASVSLFLVAVDVSRHKDFESGVAVSPAGSGYLIKCEGIDFREDVTVASVRLIDSNPFPQFNAFRTSLDSKNSSAYLAVPSAFGQHAGRLSFSRYEDRPDVLYYPKPNNDIHEVVLKVDFEPLSKVRERSLNVDQVYLKFPGFLPFPVTRPQPVSQEQGFYNDVHNGVIDEVSLQSASVWLWLGCLGFVTTGGFIAKDWKVLLFRWRLRGKLLPGRSDPNNLSRRDQTSMDAGFVLPPEWDKESIAVQFRSLRTRPGILNVFTRALVDRFVTGQDEKTAKVRIDYLRAKLVELKVAKELQGELDDLEFREVELDIRRLHKEVEKGDLEHRQRTQSELRDAEHRRDLLKIKAETIQYEKQMRDAEERPPKPTKEPSPAQTIRDRIQRLREERAYARETIKDAAELRRAENMYDDKILQLEDELRKVI